MHNITLETNRLLLRPLTLDDAQAVFEWVSDEQVARYMVYNTYENIEQVFDWLTSIQNDAEESSEYHFGFVRKSDGKLIGSGSIGPASARDGFWSFGYNFRRDCWGMGYAAEAARAMIQFAHDTLGATKFSSSHVEPNRASGRVMEKCGLHFEKYSQFHKLDGSGHARSMDYVGDWNAFLQTTSWTDGSYVQHGDGHPQPCSDIREAITRISHMEHCMHNVSDALHTAPNTLLTNVTLRAKARELTAYMDSGHWLKDYERDERGELPTDLKRGVLSEDGLYNLLAEIREHVPSLSEYDVQLFSNVDFLKSNEIQLVLESATGGDAINDRVPAYHFAICNLNGTKMGVCDLRIGHNDKLYYGGNIGYRIEEEFRGNHYAGKACLLLFDLARKHGMEYVIITCTPNNYPSQKTCEYAGCKLLEIATLPEDNDMRRRGETEECIYRFEL